MRTKKLITAILTFAAIFIISIFANKSQAASLGYVKTTRDRTEGEITYRHQLYSGTQDVKDVWKLVTCTKEGTILNNVKDLYCLRAGLGFTQANPKQTVVEYTQSYDLPRQYENVKKYFSTLKSETTIFDENQEANFNAVMWILDNMLLEGATDDQVNTYLKKYAGYTDETINKLANKENVLTRADIEAIQQLAIWYFTNNDEEEFNKEVLPVLNMMIIGGPYNTKGDEKEYKTFADIFNMMLIGNFGTERQQAAATLYNKLITDAKKVTKDYKPTRDIRVFLAGGDAANEQPIVRVKEAGELDVALRKFISEVDGNKLEGEQSRAPEVDTSKLNQVIDGKKQTTAIYNHKKTPVKVEIGKNVTYTLRLYNEGSAGGYIKQVADYLPEYLQYVPYGKDKDGVFWLLDETGRVATTTPYCEVVNVGGNVDPKDVGKPLGEVYIPEAEYNSQTKSYILSYVDIQITCKLIASTPYETNITNIAEIVGMTDKNDKPLLEDRDSTAGGNLTLPEDDKLPDYTGGKNGKNDPYYDGSNRVGTEENSYYPGQEDDDDFEKIYVESPEIDVALRKFISAVGEEKYDRSPKVDTNGLKTGTSTTAIYRHSKEPIKVEIGDIITYTIRLYNEGEVDARVSEVKDHLDKNLKYVASENEKDIKWWTEETGKEYNALTSTENCKVVRVGGKTDKKYVNGKLSDAIIPAYDKENDKLSYVDIEVQCKVLPTGKTRKLTNIAEISKQADRFGTPADNDRDSEPNKGAKLPEYNKLPDYTGGKNGKNDPYYDGSNRVGTEENPYYPGQEDDDDFEKVLVEPKFDLALRKFITKVGETPVNNRYPVVSYKDGKLQYDHTKKPLDVVTGDIVTYTIRIYNEGEADGYANEITDDMPKGLEFLPENKTNITYRWKMLDENQKETTDVKKAKYIITDYLSEEQEKETKRDNLIKAFNKEEKITATNPNFKDVQIAFKVTYKATTTEESARTIINTAQISADSDDDIDSIPNRDEVYDHEKGKNEDDIDFDQVKVKYFDLSLLKWVGQTQITLNGKTETKDTGHTVENAKNEDAVKIEIPAKDVKKIKIKYIYTIRVTNEGEIAGYAKEITDYIPAGLKFVKEDNPDWYEISNGVVGTKALENKLLQPGEFAEVKITLTWINGAENFGEKVNLAEISKDYNESDSPDVDSTPNNKVPGEDDIDDAPVILTVKTGKAQTYVGLTLIILVTFAGGIGLIKKYVLE